MQSIKKELKRISLENLIPIEIPDNVFQQIRFLCSEISKVEWSGVLFYSVEGSIKDFSNMKIRIEHIFPMHKGTSGYTEYDYDETIIDYRMNNPESLKWKVGHIHSHNKMDVFFSGTDLSELNDNAPFHNYYLSLIVNNFMEMTAKIAFIGEISSYTCKDEQGEDYPFEIDSKEQVLFTFDTTITGSTLIPTVDDDFKSRVDTIIKDSDAKQAKIDELRKTSTYTPSSTVNRELYPKQAPKTSTPLDFDFKTKSLNQFENDRPGFKKNNEDFTRFVLRMGDNTIASDTLDCAMEDLSSSDIKYFDFISSILNNYHIYYSKYWNGKDETLETFIVNTEEVIEYLEDYIDVEFTEKLVSGLQIMLNALEPKP